MHPHLKLRIYMACVIPFFVFAFSPFQAIAQFQEPVGVAGEWLFDIDSDDQENYGQGVAVSGDWAIVGRPGGDGILYFYQRIVGANGTATWVLRQQEDDPDGTGGTGSNKFGYAIDIDGDARYAVIGAPENENNGKAYIYRRNASDEWRDVAELEYPFSTVERALFGWSVAIDGNRVVIGSPRSDGTTNFQVGGVSVFERDGSENWTSIYAAVGPRATNVSEVDELNYGWSVDIEGNQVFVSAPGAERDGLLNMGVVEVLDLSGATPSSSVIAHNGSQGDEFGISLAASAGRVIVGTLGLKEINPQDGLSDTRANEVFIYAENPDGSGSWLQQKNIELGNREPEKDLPVTDFGATVALDGDFALVSTPAANLVRLFYWDGIDWLEFDQLFTENAAASQNNARQPQSSVDAEDAFQDRDDIPLFSLPRDFGDRFGSTLAINGNQVFIGMPFGEGTSTSSSNFEDTGFDSGIVFAFDVDTGNIVTGPTAITIGQPGDVVVEFIHSSSDNPVSLYRADETGFPGKASVTSASTGNPVMMRSSCLLDNTPVNSNRISAGEEFIGNTSPQGCRIRSTSGFGAGDVFEFSLCVQEDSDRDCEKLWSTDPSKNIPADPFNHAIITELYPEDYPGRVFRLNWEETEGGGDMDFDDFVAVVRVIGDLDGDGWEEGDLDGDGLWDDWETKGVDANGDGVIDLELNSKHDHKDLFLQLDWMGDCVSTRGGCSSTHNHRPSVEVLNMVDEAFNNAPVNNPDNTTGIELHYEVSSSGIRHEANITTNYCGTIINSGERVSLEDVKKANIGDFESRFSPPRRAAFLLTHRYGVFAHALGQPDDQGTSGCGELPGNDFVVTLGKWGGSRGSDFEQAGTLMHEFGHTLGLRHGGNDNVNNKPNFLSVMNYNFQTNGLRRDANPGDPAVGPEVVLDYSGEALADLDESALDETTGLGTTSYPNATTVHYTTYKCLDANNNTTDVTGLSGAGIDWDCSGAVDMGTVSASINGDVTLAGNAQIRTLRGFDDWANIVYDFQGQQSFASGDVVIPIDFEEPSRVDLVMPVADAGIVPDGNPFTNPGLPFEPYTCALGETISLDGSGSSDSFGEITAYEWDFPAGNRIDATGVAPSFSCTGFVDAVTVQLTVVDEMEQRVSDDATVQIILQLAEDRTVPKGPPVVIGSGVFSDTTLTYVWTNEAGDVLGDTPQLALKTSGPGLILPVGVHPLTLTVTDKRGNSITDSIVITVEGITFTLIDAESNVPVPTFDPIPEGAVLDLSVLPTALNIRANLLGTAHEVRFAFNGQDDFNIEFFEPYALCEDIEGDYFACLFAARENTLTATPYDEAGNAGEPGELTFMVVNEENSVASFVLVNAETNEDIVPLSDGDTIDLGALPTQLNIRTVNDDKVESMRFDLSPNGYTRVENVVPYLLFGDIDGDYLPGTFHAGENILTATPFTDNRATGVQGETVTVTFTVENSTGINPMGEPPTGSSEEQVETTHTDTEASDVQRGLPLIFELVGSYPNPFNPQAIIVYDVPENSQVALSVSDVLGRTVSVLVDGEVNAGRHEAVFDAQDLPSGLYLARLVTPSGVFIHKMIFAK